MLGRDLMIVGVVLLWVVVFTVSVAVSPAAVAPTSNLVLMGVAGALLVARRSPKTGSERTSL